jgi:hypothetical protein
MRNRILNIGIALNLVFALFYFKAYWQPDWIIQLKSPSLEVNLTSLFLSENQTIISDSSQKQLSPDSLKLKKPQADSEFLLPKDSMKKVLLIGDSQLESLRFPVKKKLKDNGYDYLGSIIWYGSSTKQWATTDTIEFFYNKFKPDFILFALGLNELFVKDLENRTVYCQNIKNKMKELGIPFYFIGPAAWVKDNGITTVMKTEFKELFFSSETLILERASDGRHPSRVGAIKWFDEVAKSMTQNKILDLDRSIDTTYRDTSPTLTLQVPE